MAESFLCHPIPSVFYDGEVQTKTHFQAKENSREELPAWLLSPLFLRLSLSRSPMMADEWVLYTFECIVFGRTKSGYIQF